MTSDVDALKAKTSTVCNRYGSGQGCWYGGRQHRNGGVNGKIDGLRDVIPVYVAAKCGYGSMFWILRALGITDAIKLDGGGSFILRNENFAVSTPENRRIHNVGIWEG